MRKISWLAILLIGGCTLILEQSNLVSLNDSSEFRFLDEQVFIRSCRQLKEESYDIFYAAENQKCLEDNAKQIQKLSEQIEQTNNLIKKEKLLDDVLVSSEKFNACKISKGLTVAGFAEQSNDSAVACWKRDKIIAYFTQVYQICENGEYFDKNDGNRIVADYQTVARQKEKNTPKIEKFKELKSEISSQNQINRKIAALLAEDNLIIRKMQQAAPDFMRVKVNKCPIIFFVQFLIEDAAKFNSDFASANNYQFKKKDADTLVLTVGDIEYTFLKKGKDRADVIVVKDVDQWGNQIINKSTILNNIDVSSSCWGYVRSGGED